MMSLPLNNILFIDIETVPQHPSYAHLPEEWKILWHLKAQYLLRNKEEESFEILYPRAGIYAEFGKIICISCGCINGSPQDKKITLKSFYGDEERLVLQQFSEMLKKWTDENKYLCAHNGKEFDFPYLCRRLIVNDLPIPQILQLSGKKPWQVNHLDTLDLWKFGDYKSYTSLNLLAHTLGIQNPKDDIDGSMVWDIYWSANTPEEKEKNMARIVTYCQKYVFTVAQVFLRMNGEELLKEENIDIKS
jgi:uncharacterized protein YprB with RNaseH-like and TPR domain